MPLLTAHRQGVSQIITRLLREAAVRIARLAEARNLTMRHREVTILTVRQHLLTVRHPEVTALRQAAEVLRVVEAVAHRVDQDN